MYSHLCRKHLGLALMCPYCKEHLFWNSKGWKAHMDSKHKGLLAFTTDLHDEAEYTQALLSSVQQDVAAPPPTKRHCKAVPTVAKEDSPTEDSSSDSSDSEDPPADPDVSAPLTEEKAITLIYGGTLLVAQSTTEALMQHSSSTLPPKPTVLAHHEHSTEAKSELVNSPLPWWLVTSWRTYHHWKRPCPLFLFLSMLRAIARTNELSFLFLFIFFFSKGVSSQA